MRNFVSKRVASVRPSGIRKFFDIAATMEGVVSLGIGEPDFDTPLQVVEAGIAALKRGETHYTSNSGLLELRKVISDHIGKLYGVEYDPQEEILVTVGVSEALYLALTAIIDPGDEIIVPEPSFVSYVPEIVLAGGNPVVVPTYVENNFEVTAKDIEAAITPQTKAIFIGYPNNPTGAILNRKQLAAIGQVAKKHDLLVISDEIYDRLVYGVQHTCFSSLPGMRERSVVLQGLSKAYAMTGWRVGYILAPPELLGAMRKIHQYTVMSAPTVSQYAGLAALQEGEDELQAMVQRYDRRRRLIVDGLNNIGLACFEPRGAFYAFPSIKSTGMDQVTFAEKLLMEEKVAVVPGSAFGDCGSGYVRCSYATAYDQIEVALERMRRFVERYK